MKYLRKLNESTIPDGVIKILENYTSDIILSIELNTGKITYYTEPSDVNLIVTFVDKTTKTLRIRSNSGVLDAFLNGTYVQFRGSKRSIEEYVSRLLDYIELVYRNIQSYNNKKLTVNKMFKIITQEVLEEYFAELTDYNEYKIEKYYEFNEDLFWKVQIKHNFSIFGNRNINIDIDKNYIDTMDSLISISGRLKDVFDVSVIFRVTNEYLVICILANNEDKPIGIPNFN